VATKAELWLRLLQQAVLKPARFVGQFWYLEEIGLRRLHRFAEISHLINKVRRVALIARNAMPGVLGFPKEVLHFAGCMTAQTVGGVFFRASIESENRMLLQRFGYFGIVAMRGFDRVSMRFGGTVAGFAALDIRLVRKGQLGMRGLIEFR
jgi:hypothetical protein